jgi:hypothetical protein
MLPSSLTETEKHKFAAKDGRWYASYTKMAEANQQANEEHLRSIGLLDTLASLKKKKKRTPAQTTAETPATRRIVSPEPTRRSPRVRKSAPANRGLAFDFVEPLKKKTKRVILPKEDLTEQDISALQSVPDWLDDMDEWLRTVPHGNGNKPVSPANARSVMKQVRKLVSGIGITYHHWRPGTYFQRGLQVHLGMNFDSMFQKAVEMEDTNGKDLGNGWLLKHPIRKLELYQEYRATQKKRTEK